jgi:uncharacterized protein YyaL (SSP411 family)
MRFLDRARCVVDAVVGRFEAREGGFYDRLPGLDEYGRLAVADRPIVENGLFADVLLRLGALCDEQRYVERAEALLRLYASDSAAAGPFAATYARALRRFLNPGPTIRIVGDPAKTDEFREAALRLPSPFTQIRTLSPQQAADLALPPESAAYVCAGSACVAPVREPGGLRDAYDALATGDHVRTNVSQYQQPQRPTSAE